MIYETKIEPDPNDPEFILHPRTGEKFYRGTLNIHVDTEIITGDEAWKIVDKYERQMPTTTHPPHPAIIDLFGIAIGPFIQGLEGQIFYDALLNVGTHGPFGYNKNSIEEKMKPWQPLTGQQVAGTDLYVISSPERPGPIELDSKLNSLAKETYGLDFMTKLGTSGSYAIEDAQKIAEFNKFRQLKERLGDELYERMCNQLGIRKLRDDGLMSNYPVMAMAFKGAFHGRTKGALSVTYSKLAHKEGFQTLPWAWHLPFDESVDFDSVIDPRPIEELIRNDELAYVVNEQRKIPIDLLSYVIMEPIQGEGGYRIPPPEFLEKLDGFLGKYKDRGIVFISDEVQAGIWRTGSFSAMSHYTDEYPNLTPDILTFAKPLIVSATVTRKDLFENWPGSKMSGTLSQGNTPGIARAYYTLVELQGEDPYLGISYTENAKIRGEQLRQGIEKLNENYGLISDVRGIGQMNAFDLPDSETRDKLECELFLHGTHGIGTGQDSLRIFSAVDQRPREVDILLQALDDSLKALN